MHMKHSLPLSPAPMSRTTAAGGMIWKPPLFYDFFSLQTNTHTQKKKKNFSIFM